MTTFSIRARVKSFRYAFAGLNAFFNSQHNAIIHFVFTAVVFGASIYFNVSGREAIALTIVTAFVWSAELFNTAIEKLCDMVTKEYHPSVKFIKDVSAAAVLIAAAAAVITGTIIFLPKILS